MNGIGPTFPIITVQHLKGNLGQQRNGRFIPRSHSCLGRRASLPLAACGFLRLDAQDETKRSRHVERGGLCGWSLCVDGVKWTHSILLLGFFFFFFGLSCAIESSDQDTGPLRAKDTFTLSRILTSIGEGIRNQPKQMYAMLCVQLWLYFLSFIDASESKRVIVPLRKQHLPLCTSSWVIGIPNIATSLTCIKHVYRFAWFLWHFSMNLLQNFTHWL